MLKILRIQFLIIVIALLITSVSFAQQANIIFQPIEADKEMEDISKVAYGNGIFVAGGKNGKIATSKDGMQWIVQNSETKEDILKMRYVNKIFFAILSNKKVISSPDGVLWKIINIDGATIGDIVYANKKYIGFGDDIITSDDGKDWSVRYTSKECKLESAFWNGYEFIAYGNQKEIDISPENFTNVFKSKDGITWEESRSQYLLLPGTVCYGKGKYIACGYDIGEFSRNYYHFSYIIFTSEDGLQWSKAKEIPPFFPPCNILWTGYKFIAYYENTFMRSQDGDVWELIDSLRPSRQATAPRGDLVYGNNIFVQVGGRNGAVGVSKDLRNWTFNNIVTGFVGTRIFKNGKTYIVSSIDGITTSKDLKAWYKAEGFSKFSFDNDIIIANKKYVTISNDIKKMILFSNNGEDFTDVYDSKEGFAGVLWDGEKFIVPSIKKYILTSKDGVNWFKKRVNFDYEMKGIKYNGSQYIIFCTSGTILISHNLTNWQVVKTLASKSVYITNVVTNGTIWLANTSNKQSDVNRDYTNRLYYSYNGIKWNPIDIGFRYIDDVFFEGNNFLCVVRDNGRVGNWADGKIMISEDSFKWIDSGGILGYCNDIAWDGTKYIALFYGSDKIIYTGQSIK